MNIKLLHEIKDKQNGSYKGHLVIGMLAPSSPYKRKHKIVLIGYCKY